MQKKKGHGKLTFIIILLSILAVAFMAVAIILFLFAGYEEIWYPNTVINSVDVSELSYQEAEDKIKKHLEASYVLYVRGREQGSLKISGEDIGFRVNLGDELKKIYQVEHEGFSLKNLMEDNIYEIAFTASFDRDKLHEIITTAPIVTGSDTYQINKPKKAYVTYSEEKGCAVIVPETDGNVIIEEKLEEIVVNAIAKLETDLDIADKEKYPDVYKKAKRLSANKKLKKLCNTYNRYLLNWITWDMGKDTYETIAPEDIRQWLEMDKKKYKVIFDKEAMSEWVEAFCLKYKTVGTKRTFTTHSGEKIEVEGGDYGWRLDYETTVEQAYNAIKKKKKQALIDAYIAEPTEENKENLTVMLEPEYKSKGFKRDYKNFENDWNKKNYSEVDLSEQKVYVYKDGKLAYSCICVTGLPTKADRITRTGCWYVKDKKLKYTLTGADYSVDTRYWIRIMWTGTGYHYLNRSDWKRWSPSLYKTKGSHGCINLQYKDAKAIYDLIELYDPVFIHE